MFYPARLEPAPEGDFAITFRDIPETITQGDTLGDARRMAEGALISTIDFYFEDIRRIPAPSPPLYQ